MQLEYRNCIRTVSGGLGNMQIGASKETTKVFMDEQFEMGTKYNVKTKISAWLDVINCNTLEGNILHQRGIITQFSKDHYLGFPDIKM